MSDFTKSSPEEILRHHDLKATPQRIEVLAAFLKKAKVLSLTELSKTLGKDFDRITLYRTLNSFAEHGIIHTIPDNAGNTNYALCRHDSVQHTHTDNHVHFKCTNCNLTVCLEDVEIPQVKIPKKFKPLKYSFLIEGICEDCISKNK